MNLIKSLTVFAVVSALAASLAFAADEHKQAACCAKAAKDGNKACEHECCVKAAKDGKECEKCGGKGNVEKKEEKKEEKKDDMK